MGRSAKIITEYIQTGGDGDVDGDYFYVLWFLMFCVRILCVARVA